MRAQRRKEGKKELNEQESMTRKSERWGGKKENEKLEKRKSEGGIEIEKGKYRENVSK